MSELSFHELSEANAALTALDDPLEAARATLGFAESRFSALRVASSFSVEDVVLMHLAQASAPSARVFTLDTGRLHEETYQVMDELRALGLSFEVYAPEAQALEALVNEGGHFSFRASVQARKACCAVRKLEPLKRALKGADAWATGLRREQAVTRAQLLPLEHDVQNGLIKLNPLFRFSEDEVWAYAKSRALPTNALHALGFPSIGCAPCTRAVAPGEHARAGRWWWESPETKECGLHASPVQLQRSAS